MEQQEGILSCKEAYSGQREITRRLQLTGLKNATVRIYPEEKITAEKLQLFPECILSLENRAYQF